MEHIEILDSEDDWEVLTSFFPYGWEEKAKDLGALLRCRKFLNAESLLRTLLIHLADGCSLRETTVRARKGNIVSVSDVALLKRLKVSGEWLRWMASQIMSTWITKQPSAIFGKGLNIRVVDGSTIQEPGATGSTWRIHYSIRLPSLQCDEVFITSTKKGESFKRFTVHPGDLFLGDRGFAHRAGISHVVNAGADVIVRINLTNVPLVDNNGKPFPLLPRLRTLTGRKLGNWEVWVPYEDTMIPGRICALKKNKLAVEKARRKTLKENSRKGRKVKPETLEATGYIFVFTTFDRRFGPESILEMYRGRWQVELAFKRLKSIIGIGHLKKSDMEAAKAWMHGKLLVAFLIEALIIAGESFFPWGYPICSDIPEVTISLEGNLIDASPF